MKAGLNCEACGEAGTECLGLLHVLYYQVPCHIRAADPQTADISIEIPLGALCILFQIQLQMGFGLPNPIPVWSLFLLCCLTLPPALECFPLTSKFCQELVVHASRYVLLPLLDFLHVRGCDPWKSVSSPSSLYLQGCIPCDSFLSQDSESSHDHCSQGLPAFTSLLSPSMFVSRSSPLSLASGSPARKIHQRCPARNYVCLAALTLQRIKNTNQVLFLKNASFGNHILTVISNLKDKQCILLWSQILIILKKQLG